MTEDKPKRIKAIALRYQEFEPAPKVLAKGEGVVAEKIIELAREHQLFVHNSPELIELLSQVDVDDYIPQTLWLIIAELLVWAKEIDVD